MPATDASFQAVTRMRKTKTEAEAVGGKSLPLLAYVICITGPKDVETALANGTPMRVSMIDWKLKSSQVIADASYAGEVQAYDLGTGRAEEIAGDCEEVGLEVNKKDKQIDITDSSSMVERVLRRAPRAENNDRLTRSLLKVTEKIKSRRLVHTSDKNMLVDILGKDSPKEKRERFRKMMDGWYPKLEYMPIEYRLAITN